MLALYQFGSAFDADWAIGLANQTAQRVIALQGPRGEWGWFYYVPRGSIVDFYKVYSVHQHGRAPAFPASCGRTRGPGGAGGDGQRFPMAVRPKRDRRFDAAPE